MVLPLKDKLFVPSFTFRLIINLGVQIWTISAFMVLLFPV